MSPIARSGFSLILFFLFMPSLNAGWPTVRGVQGMVATADKYATDVGMSVLERGGNAIDAAVAVGFALAVTYPQAGNIGGGGFMLIRIADQKTYALDYREKAPQLASKDMYISENGTVFPEASTIGYLATGVPGTVAGLYKAHQKFGKLPWAELLQPAIDLAQDGFVLDRYQASSLLENNEIFNQFSSSRNIFTNQGSPFSEGDVLVQTDLTVTLRKIQTHGRDGFYTGETAIQIAEQMKLNGGLITESDLKNYEAVWREPVHFTYRGYDLFSMPLPSSGGILLAEILNTLENVNLSNLGANSSKAMHIWTEAERQAYADRATYLGDGDFIKSPVADLISKAYAKTIFEAINPYFARSSMVTQASDFEHLETTHFSIVDADGNAVSNTYTLNGSYGSSVVIEGTGVLMNNEMDDFSIKPGFPNMYGLIGSSANAIAPGKRMLSSMTPTIVEKEGEIFLVLGSPGGSTIITTVAQVISNVIDHRMNIRDAVEKPRFHHQWYPDEIKYEEAGFAVDVLENLRARGHKLTPVQSLGDVQAIHRDVVNNEWNAWSDPRRNGISKGY